MTCLYCRVYRVCLILISPADQTRLLEVQSPNIIILQLCDSLDSCNVGEAVFESEKIEMFVVVGEYFHENYYEFVEIKPQILTCLTNLESNFTSRFSIPSLF